jgi:alpha-tubulin suppressor-like RCC1 family protein
MARTQARSGAQPLPACILGLGLALALLAGCGGDNGDGANDAAEVIGPAETVTETSADSTGPEAIDEVATETTGGTLAPVFQPLARWKETVCAIDTQGAGWCWGSNDGYILGVGPGGSVNSPEPVAIAGNHKWMALALGREHGCGLDDGGHAWCWGTGWTGELGNGQSTVKPAPVEVSGGRAFTDLSTGWNHSVALDAAGQAWCWGHNQDGVFGDGTTVDSNLPVPCATGLVLADIDAERRSTCGVTRAGELYCWGSGYQSAAGADSPARMGTRTDWRAVSNGDDIHCALDTNDAAWCWGATGNSGVIGDAAGIGDSKEPLEIAGAIQWKAVSAGINSCGVAKDGAAYCWGPNSNGQIGDGAEGTDAKRMVPTAVVGGYSWSTIVPGSCGVTTGNAAYCWGSNESGELGTGSTGENSLTPAAVAGEHSFAAP